MHSVKLGSQYTCGSGVATCESFWNRLESYSRDMSVSDFARVACINCEPGFRMYQNKV